VLSALPPLRALLFGGPFATFAVLLWHRRWRAWPRLLTLTVLTVVATLGTLTVTVLGDGLADVAKQGHLIYNAALTWWIAALVIGTRTPLLRARPDSGSVKRPERRRFRPAIRDGRYPRATAAAQYPPADAPATARAQP